jgi:hypothetical protein
VPHIPVWGPTISLAEEQAPSFILSFAAGVLATLSSREGRSTSAPSRAQTK